MISTRNRGFALPELLVSLGVIAILLALLIPAVAGARRITEETIGLSNVREIGRALSLYAEDNRGTPPTFWEPVYYPSTETLPRQRFGTYERAGSWWSCAGTYHFAFSPPLPRDVLVPPNIAVDWPATINGGQTSGITYYQLTETLFAEPAFWDHETMQGPAQWRAQRLDDARYPSSKGMLHQVWTLADPRMRNLEHDFALPFPFLWFDHSATTDNFARLTEKNPGIANPWRPDAHNVVAGSPATAVIWTRHGILGRDR